MGAACHSKDPTKRKIPTDDLNFETRPSKKKTILCEIYKILFKKRLNQKQTLEEINVLD